MLARTSRSGGRTRPILAARSWVTLSRVVSCIICETAKRPMSAGIKLNPPNIASRPKSKRGSPSSSETPKVAANIPRSAVTSPRDSLLPVSAATAVSAKTETATNSAKWNLSAKVAISGASSTRKIPLMTVPKNDATTAFPIA